MKGQREIQFSWTEIQKDRKQKYRKIESDEEKIYKDRKTEKLNSNEKYDESFTKEYYYSISGLNHSVKYYQQTDVFHCFQRLNLLKSQKRIQGGMVKVRCPLPLDKRKNVG